MKFLMLSFFLLSQYSIADESVMFQVSNVVMESSESHNIDRSARYRVYGIKAQGDDGKFYPVAAKYTKKGEAILPYVDVRSPICHNLNMDDRDQYGVELAEELSVGTKYVISPYGSVLTVEKSRSVKVIKLNSVRCNTRGGVPAPVSRAIEIRIKNHDEE